MCKSYYVIVGGLKHELQARASEGEYSKKGVFVVCCAE